MKEKNKKDEIKLLIKSFTLPAVIICFWLYFFSGDLKEIFLFTSETKEVNGEIIKVDTSEDYTESNNGKSTVKSINFSYVYTFKLENQEIITSYRYQEGYLPESLENVNLKPTQVTVQYLVSNPEINRVKAKWFKIQTIIDWFRYRFIVGFIILLFCCYASFKYYRTLKNKQNQE